MLLYLLGILTAGLTAYAFSIVIEKQGAFLGLAKAPNERSSHIVPTARGGGVGIALAGTVGCGLIALYDVPMLAIVSALGAVIALTGFVDDLRDVSVSFRLAIQSAVIVALLVGTELSLGAGYMSLTSAGLLMFAAAILAGIWWINAFNFMDGIDGIAASQAMLVLAGAMLLWLHADPHAPNDPVFAFMLLVAAATGGFLLRNWPPAKIFMGDAGSTYLGFSLFAALVITVANGTLPLITWIVLLSVFVTDSAMTIIRRTARGERPWLAHRRHAYQQLSRLWGHQKVTLLYAGLTALWAFPLAAASMAVPSSALWLVLGAYLPLGILFFVAGAGARREY